MTADPVDARFAVACDLVSRVKYGAALPVLRELGLDDVGFLLVGVLGFVMPELLGAHLSLVHNIIHLVTGAVPAPDSAPHT